jgi:PKD repeat protein
MMHSSTRWVSLLFAAMLTGCGSCSPGGQTTTKPQAPAAAPQEPAAPAAPAAQAPAAQAPATAAQPEVDCFVLVDAEPDFGPPPLKVQFETEIDCTGSPVTYSWDFGDGKTGGNEANPSHVYDKAGEYVATVKVTAPDGGEGEDEIDITADDDLDE